MERLNQLLRRAAFRLWLGRLGTGLLVASTIGLAVLTLARLGERWLSLDVQVESLWVPALVMVVIAALIWSAVRRPERITVARLLDDRAGLRQALSTAVSVEMRDDAWSRATMAYADRAAARVIIRQVMPVRIPRVWMALPLFAVLFIVSAWLPERDLLALFRGSEKEAVDRGAILEAAVEVQTAEEQIRAAFALVGEGALPQEEELADPRGEARSPQEMRLAALKKLTDAQDRLDALRDSERFQTMSRTTEMLSRLDRQPGDQIDALTRALRQGDFSKAREELEKLADRVSQADMSAAEREEIRRQLAVLAEQLAKLALDMNELERALEQAGVDPALAQQGMEAIQNAIENAQHLSQEQRDRLMSMARSTTSACEACKSLSGSISGACAAIAGAPGDMGQFGAIGQQLSAMEMMAMDLAALQAARQMLSSQCMAIGQSLKQCGGSGTLGFGSMRAGTGTGQSVGDGHESKFDVENLRVQSETRAGPIIGSVMVEGDQIRGESRAEFSQAVLAAHAAASEAIETQRIPREYHDAIKGYFGRLESKAADGENDGAAKIHPD